MTDGDRDDPADGPRLGLPASRERAALWVVTLVLAGALVYAAWRFVGTVVLGLFAYYGTRPLYRLVEPRIRSRTVAAGLAIVLITLPALVLFTWVTVIALEQLARLLQSDAVAQYLSEFGAYVDLTQIYGDATVILREVANGTINLRELGIGGLAAGVLGTLGSSLVFLGNVGLHAFIVLVIAFYLLRDDYRIAAWTRGTFMREGDVLAEFFRRVDYNLSRVYFGNIVNALLTGTIGAITYNLLNLVAPPDVPVPLPALVGVLTGLGSLVPVIGIKIVWVPVALLLLADSLVTDPSTAWFPVLFGLVSVVVVDSIPDFFLRPFVSGRSLHVGAVMLAYIFGPLLFGWYGIFLGPLLLVVLVAFARVIVPWLIDPDRPVEPLESTGSGPGPPVEREPAEGSEAADPERAVDGEEPPATESDSGDATSS